MTPLIIASLMICLQSLQLIGLVKRNKSLRSAFTLQGVIIAETIWTGIILVLIWW